MKKIITLIVLTLILSSCGTKTEETKKENLVTKLTSLSETELKDNIKKLDEEWKRLVIDFFKSEDKKNKTELKEKIQKHMIEIQSEISNIKWETIEEKNEEIQKITKKIKLYKSLGF